MNAYTINFNPVFNMTDEQFYQLCQLNPDAKFERNAKGELLIMSPTGGETGSNNATLTARFVVWNEQTKLGIVFDSSTGFKLPNGGDRSPDVAWVKKERWDALTPEQKKKFPPISPDFVLELMLPTDTLRETQAKMQEYMSSGVKLGWLVDPETRRVEIYRLGQDIEVLDAPEMLSGEDVLPSFMLNLQAIW
ncbi:MAG: Uma2 family endonuclease [Myxacorys californica WJT36-NPBG1]|jgi:Uma2 family endonuclease|nr:Uma2 family endonuclease [Myxacorys californica WJT36-NPBG1]